MKALALKSQFYFPRNAISSQNLPKYTTTTTTTITTTSSLGSNPPPSSSSTRPPVNGSYPHDMSTIFKPDPLGRTLPKTQTKNQLEVDISEDLRNGYSWCASPEMITGAAAISIGALLLIFGLDDSKALAFGPEGPMVEEFWENVRRYALYALTVSTGVIYTGLQPIIELLKNPITAVLIITIIVGTIFIVSQVLSLMVGVSDFTYEYGY